MKMEIPIIGQSRPESNVVAVPSDVMGFLAKFHEVAQKYQWALVCPKCQQQIQGSNTGHEKTYLAISCACTEWRGSLGGSTNTRQ